MNVHKTELHVMRGNENADIVSRYGAKTPTKDPRGAPHAVYKYLAVYFYTSHHANKVLDFIQAEIDSIYAHLASLNLSATELIMLTNKQLIPTVAYRLLASPLTDVKLALPQSKKWDNLARYGRLPRGLSPKNRYDGRSKGCFGLMPFQIFMRSQIYNYFLMLKAGSRAICGSTRRLQQKTKTGFKWPLWIQCMPWGADVIVLSRGTPAQ